ncbi:MAG: hypothetical protein H0X25_17005 [Acidobacteriales bacterium]|nr:hypothetical protein [Terriglobales bacterium]
MEQQTFASQATFARYGRKTRRELFLHQGRLPYDRRAAPEELRTYRLRARLLRVRREKDSDLHLLLGDLSHTDSRLIAEIPAPECAVGTGREQEYRRARAALSGLLPGTEIEVMAVAFFDFPHEQHGAAKNGIELHPVLRVRVLRPGE